MAKIVARHPEVLEDLQGFVDKLHVRERNPNSVILESPGGEAVVRLNWMGKPKRWLLTAYQTENPPRAERTIDVSGNPDGGNASAGESVGRQAPPPRGGSSPDTIAPKPPPVKDQPRFSIRPEQVHPGVPDALRREMEQWPTIEKSPYSDSYYSEKGKRWTHTPPGIFRVSDHWNFHSQGEEHARTDQPVNNGDWTLAQYDNGLWRVKASLPNDDAAQRAFGERLAKEWEARKSRIEAARAAGTLRGVIVKREYADRGRRFIGQSEESGVIVRRSAQLGNLKGTGIISHP